MSYSLGPNKAKTAKRLIEVLEFFANERRPACVMDIVEVFDRPQSSTSELMALLAEIGLLYRDPKLRTYTPTPRLAALGLAGQPRPIVDGRLFGLMEELARDARRGVALFGIVGNHSQVFRWVGSGKRPIPGFEHGRKVPLSSGAVGQLLLSTFGEAQAAKILWRLHAEVAPDHRFNLAQMQAEVARLGGSRHASGSSGFAAREKITAVLLPLDLGPPQMALGIVHGSGGAGDPQSLLAMLDHGLARCLHIQPFTEPDPHPAPIQ